MKTNNFAKYLSDFLGKYLPGERNASTNTILSYKDAFVQFITFMKKKKGVEVQKLTLEKITKDSVVEFLNWLQEEKHCSNATRNYRLAAIRSFFYYVQYENPERLFECQRILSIKIKKHRKKSINYLTTDGIKLLLEQPDLNTRNGHRNLALLALMYDSGARVQEIIDLTPSSIRLDFPSIVKLVGKGNKARIVPLQEEQIVFLKSYMQQNHLQEPHANMYPLFSNSRNEKLSRAGITYILKTYASQARNANPSIIPEILSCHSLRHSKAMHLLQAGVNLIYIRDILGHVSVQTTDIYARADSKQKREAFEKAYEEMKPEGYKVKSWEKDPNLLEWLKSLKN
ncbi:site-specific integrase [Sphingobacterium multivorum]|uniref:site-specific integrase n=1 Tax=Sphingobacterium multivorum TaxID=28454 RepID=UPI00289F1297|nr:site-specific integrase [Sphingobacterium multivorum]